MSAENKEQLEVLQRMADILENAILRIESLNTRLDKLEENRIMEVETNGKLN